MLSVSEEELPAEWQTQFGEGWRSIPIYLLMGGIITAMAALLVVDRGWERPAASLPLVLIAIACAWIAWRAPKVTFVRLDERNLTVSRGGRSFRDVVPRSEIRGFVRDPDYVLVVGDGGKVLLRIGSLMLTRVEVDELGERLHVPTRHEGFFKQR